MAKAYRLIKDVYENFLTALFAIQIFCVVFQIFARYVLSLPFPWTEELARYLLIMGGFMGAVVGFRKGGHLGAFFLRDVAKGKLRGAIYAFNSIIVLFAIAFLFYGAMQMRSAVVGLDSSTMRWFMQTWLYSSVLIGLALMFCYGIRDLYYSILVILGKKEVTLEGKSCPFPEDDMAGREGI